MIAIDTNILVRIITNDNPQQVKKAVRILSKTDVFLSKTVLLETEWVLRYLYHKNPSEIIEAFQSFLGLPNVTVENISQILLAFEWFSAGLDFADALHLASSEKAKTFMSFDSKFCKKAKKLPSITLKLLNPDKDNA